MHGAVANTERALCKFGGHSRKPATIIQKVAPGPPAAIATATPPMFPMPTVPEMAVVSAWKWVISPGASSSSNSPRRERIARGIPRTFTNLK